MGDYLASIQIDASGVSPVDPGGFSLAHHLTDAVRLEMSKPTGGHLLHAAVGMCLFNGIIALAAERELPIDRLRVDVNGDFAGEEAISSSGITYDVTVDSPASDEAVRALITEVTSDSPISRSIEQGTPIRIGSVTLGTKE